MRFIDREHCSDSGQCKKSHFSIESSTANKRSFVGTLWIINLWNCSQSWNPDHVTVLYGRMNVLPQVWRHVGGQVSEAVQCAEGEVKGEAADQSQDPVELLRGEETGNGWAERHLAENKTLTRLKAPVGLLNFLSGDENIRFSFGKVSVDLSTTVLSWSWKAFGTESL